MTYRRIEPGEYKDGIIEKLLTRLQAGESMRKICAAKDMPSRATVAYWSERDDDLAKEIYRAREIGYHERGERALDDVRKCSDPIKGRLIFDAERWYLSKLSQAFAEKPMKTEINARLQIDGTDVFGKFAGALERAASAIATRPSRTIDVVSESETGSDST